MLPGLKQGLGVQEVGGEATPGVPSTAWAEGDHPETEQVRQDVTRLRQVGRVSEAAHLGFVKWQAVFLARGACSRWWRAAPPWRLFRSTPCRAEFCFPYQKAEIKAQERAEPEGTFSLAHSRHPRRPCCQTHQREMRLPPAAASVRKCVCYTGLVSASKPGADSKDSQAMAWFAFFKNVFYR